MLNNLFVGYHVINIFTWQWMRLLLMATHLVVTLLPKLDFSRKAKWNGSYETLTEPLGPYLSD